MITFVEVLNAGVVEWVGNNFLQTVFAASTAGIHFHVAEAELLQVVTQIQWRSWLNVPVKVSVQPSLESVGRNANCVACKQKIQRTWKHSYTPDRPEKLWWSFRPLEVQTAEQLCILIHHLSILQIYQTLLLTQWKRKQNSCSSQIFLCFLYVVDTQNRTVWYLVAWKHLHCGACASSAANVAAY